MNPMPDRDYLYDARPGAVIDGDSFHATVDLGVGVGMLDINIRVLGIDCPELRVDGKPNQAGLAAKKATADWLTSAVQSSKAGRWPLRVRSHGWDKYGGRIDCEVWRVRDGRNLADDLVASGHAALRDYGKGEKT